MKIDIMHHNSKWSLLWGIAVFVGLCNVSHVHVHVYISNLCLNKMLHTIERFSFTDWEYVNGLLLWAKLSLQVANCVMLRWIIIY
jgi:hypothetical protein